MIDIIARAMAGGLMDENGNILESKLPSFTEDKPTEYHVGGLPAGMDLSGKTWQEIFILMLYGAMKPDLVDPSLNVTSDKVVVSIAKKNTISGNIIFDRGQIKPAMGTSGFRSGLPTSYQYDGKTITSSSLIIPYTIENEDVVLGENTFPFVVNFLEGEQPKDAAGDDYDSPYPAGSMTYNLIITGLNPVFSSSHGVDELEEKDVCGIYFSSPEEGKGFDFNLDAEEIGEGKQVVAIDSEINIIGIKQFNQLSEKWEWIFGTPEESLTAFTISEITKMIGGEEVIFKTYENALDVIGARELKFFVEEPQKK